MMYFEAENVSEAWVLGLDQLLCRDTHSGIHLVARIESSSEVPAIREAADQLLSSTGLPSIDRVRNTLFPAAFAHRFPEPADLSSHYVDLFNKHISGFPKNRGGTYFQRMVAYPANGGSINQLTDIVQKLRRERVGGHKSSIYEMSIYSSALDRKKSMGFPCLSFCSFHVEGDAVHLSAQYRNHFMIERCYGNYLALAQLLDYVAAASGYRSGELLVVSGHAQVEKQIRAAKRIVQSFGK